MIIFLGRAGQVPWSHGKIKWVGSRVSYTQKIFTILTLIPNIPLHSTFSMFFTLFVPCQFNFSGDVFYVNWDEVLPGATAVISTIGGFGSEEQMQRINGEANVVAVNAAKEYGKIL